MNKQSLASSAGKKILIILAVIFAVSAVVLTIESVTTSAEVASLQKKQSQELVKRQDLQSGLVSAISVSDLEEKGQELGFTKPSEIMYTQGGSSVASKN